MTVRAMDGFPGVTFTDITRGETLPFSFTFTEDDQVTPIDVTGYKVYLAFSSKRELVDPEVPELEVTLDPTDVLNGIISGTVTDSESFTLPLGKLYCSARYVTPTGEAYMIDKASVQVTSHLNPRLDQT